MNLVSLILIFAANQVDLSKQLSPARISTSLDISKNITYIVNKSSSQECKSFKERQDQKKAAPVLRHTLKAGQQQLILIWRRDSDPRVGSYYHHIFAARDAWLERQKNSQ